MTILNQTGEAFVGADVEFTFTLTTGDATTMTLEADLTHVWGGSRFARYTEGNGITVDDTDTVRVEIPATDSVRLSAQQEYRLALWDTASGSVAPLGIATILMRDGGRKP